MKHDRRPLTAVIALALLATQLGGCVAAALVPLAAGGTLTGKQLLGRKTKRPKVAAQAPVKPVVIVGQGAPGAAPAPTPPAPAPSASAPASAPAIPAAIPAESAAPSPALALAEGPETTLPASAAPIAPARGPAGEDGYAAMAAFVLSAADPAKANPTRRSALLDQASLASVPKTMMCEDQRGALLIDLDIGADPFDLNDPPSPAPGLAEYLRAIRGTGTAVVWIASLPEASAKQLGTVLKATGLDPLGIDPVMLLRRNETRKQQILLRADADWCVLAIAGDRKADFDEVFDYLRNPDGPVAVALEQNIGAGWFLVPPPIK
ncbi:MAG: hypothetical protein B7Y36_17940 [Novosphingobium sp. 28-62-57]|uniref:hypothetical protein n=1 Tax=unclassified Novosphingobium TaxID=2644732 RepID=UPI000BC94E13|nr:MULTISPECIES: hypothetical protein [unclassified Novosphingobium]OYW48055.1 MAG: hypothetical protein B7Z34_15020 [Novosphingobium sp. 12-62-10]OYZ08188.1 MAG: hypothetical protein B7Y36_17940 [Novosphingobium sp. 28-62-57]OZA36132.1 MAG: hypothetical protein B7X92_07480 [Novosphingobium sp. 17-62-9]HQS71482.1 hypothetical protein [Novosphingobium sp.]